MQTKVLNSTASIRPGFRSGHRATETLGCNEPPARQQRRFVARGLSLNLDTRGGLPRTAAVKHYRWSASRVPTRPQSRGHTTQSRGHTTNIEYLGTKPPEPHKTSILSGHKQSCWGTHTEVGGHTKKLLWSLSFLPLPGFIGVCPQLLPSGCVPSNRRGVSPATCNAGCVATAFQVISAQPHS